MLLTGFFYFQTDFVSWNKMQCVNSFDFINLRYEIFSTGNWNDVIKLNDCEEIEFPEFG